MTPEGFNNNGTERFQMWRAEPLEVPQALRDLADFLEANPDVVLYHVVNAPVEPESFSAAAVLQVVVSRLDGAA